MGFSKDFDSILVVINLKTVLSINTLFTDLLFHGNGTMPLNKGFANILRQTRKLELKTPSAVIYESWVEVSRLFLSNFLLYVLRVRFGGKVIV
jgi:hypothetical protein